MPSHVEENTIMCRKIPLQVEDIPLQLEENTITSGVNTILGGGKYHDRWKNNITGGGVPCGAKNCNQQCEDLQIG